MDILNNIDNSLFKIYLLHSNPKPFKIFISNLIQKNTHSIEDNKNFKSNLLAIIDKNCNFKESFYMNHFIQVSEAEYRFLKTSFINFLALSLNIIVLIKINKREFVFMDNNRYLVNNLNKLVIGCSIFSSINTGTLMMIGLLKWLVYCGFKNNMILDEEQEIVNKINFQKL
jgi:hypothetical protein